jgi:hypothetical protein
MIKPLFSNCEITIDMVISGLINGPYHLPCFALLVLLVATAKIHFEEQLRVLGTKQSRQADKADS